MMTAKDQQSARVKFHCRRGMLELDALLHAFYEQHFHQLDAMQRQLFEQLLDEDDPDLYRWFIGMEAVHNPEYQFLIEQIRNMTK